MNRTLSARYVIEELIGSGGMANVYKAYDTVEKRTVAIKVLKEEHREDAEFVRRFEREAKAVLMLSHENIVRSYDVGEDGDWSYIVLEYVEGSTLKEIIKSEGSLSPKTAVNIACQVLDALSHAHECGIIHRDVKPQNVIITPRGRAKLTDFGIARDAASTTRTFVGANVVGSVHYISPEQARGDNVNAATDLYSCSIMLYEMLTGEVPFGGDNSVAIALKHLQEDITPPNELNPRIPRALSDVIVKGSSKSLKTRYATARQMKNDLQRALREPNGKFARLDGEDAPKKRQHTGIINIALALLLVLGMFTALFFTARAIRDDDSGKETEYVIPTVEGKTLSEGSEIASLRGFLIVIDGYESSSEYDTDVIISQDPAAGSSAKAGDAISVTLSSGNDYIIVPELSGGSVQDALTALADMDLVLGAPAYVTSDSPSGTVIRQEPAAGTETFAGDTIDIWVSGTPGANEEMPTLVGLDLDVALNTLKDDGFTKVVIHPSTPTELSTEDRVLKQSPTAGLSVSLDMRIDLWICRVELGNCKSDVAFNIDAGENGCDVLVTAVIDEGVELVLYETSLASSGPQPVSFTAHMQDSGERQLNVYVDGKIIKTCTAVFRR